MRQNAEHDVKPPTDRAHLGDLQPGPNKGPFRVAISGIEVRTTKNGDAFLQLDIHDSTGKHSAKCFDGAHLVDELGVGDAVEIRSLNHDPKYGPKFAADAVRRLERGQFSPAEFVPSLPREQVERDWKEFNRFLDGVKDPHLQELRRRIWGDDETAAKYKWHTSAVGHHHNYRGGNLQHVVGIMRVVDAISTSYPEIDRDLVVFGAAVHDLGKLEEYAVDTTIRVTDAGKLEGHLVIGARWIRRLVSEIRSDGQDFPDELEDHLAHMILSHHGRGEWGSPKPPATPEAMLLHVADYADSQAKGFLQRIEENRDAPDGWAGWFDRDIGQYRNVRVQ